MGLTATVIDIIRRAIPTWPERPNQTHVYDLLHFLARWRSQMLALTYLRHHGAKIYGGPFGGMDYVEDATEGALIARLLGSYESELHPHIEGFAREGLDCVIDIGCAEGYYAVGLARQFPEITVYAHDISEEARAACTALAAKNGLADRVLVGGEFKPADFQSFAGRRVLVMVDAEGAEVDILRPELAPALATMNIIVETHDGLQPGALKEMADRFRATHHLQIVKQGPKVFEMPPWLQDLSHLDQLIAAWEWRSTPTPWLVMRPRGR